MSFKSDEHRNPKLSSNFLSACVAFSPSSWLNSSSFSQPFSPYPLALSTLFAYPACRTSSSPWCQILGVKRVKAPPILPVAQTTAHYIYNTFIHPPPPCHKQTTPSNPSSSAPLSHLPRLPTDGQASPPPYHSLAPPYIPPRDRSSTLVLNSN